MVWIPGSNNGTFGMGMARGAVFPANMGGPFGYQGFPLPNMIQHPTGVMDKPYLGRAFGKRFGNMVYQLTPGGVTTEAGWGFTNKAKHFGRRRRSRKGSKRRSRKGSKRRSRRRSRKGSKRRSRRSRRLLMSPTREATCKKCGTKFTFSANMRSGKCPKCGELGW